MKRMIMLLTVVSLLISVKPVLAQAEYTFAVTPEFSKLEIMSKYAPLVGELKKATGANVKLMVADNFEQHLQWLKTGHVDFAYSTPVVVAHALDYVDLLVTAVYHGKPELVGEIVVMNSSPIKTVGDCKGKKVGVVSFESGGGYLSQKIGFLQEGIEMLKECKVSPIKDGNVNNLIKALEKNTFDAICVPHADIAKMSQILGKGNYRILGEGVPVPNWAVTCKKGMDPTIERKITAGFLGIPEKSESLKSLEIDSFTPSSDDWYEPINYILTGND